MGHCACEALGAQTGLLKVYIRCSDVKAKKARIVSEYGIPEQDVDTVRRRFDKKRSNYYGANTGRRWTDAANYDIVLDSGTLGIEGCVKVLCSLAEK